MTFGDLRLPPRFWARVTPVESECWLWTGRLMWKGYPVYWHGGRNWRAHRLVVATDGRDPDGMDVDHLCRNRACVNPAHLDVVTSHQNQARRRKLVCDNGHPYDETNTGSRPDGGRYCRGCVRENMRIFRARRRETAARAA